MVFPLLSFRVLFLYFLKEYKSYLKTSSFVLTRQGHLINTEHGFRSGRSCLAALLDVFDDIMHNIHEVGLLYFTTRIV